MTELFGCTFPDCPIKGTADRMWNLPAKKGAEKPVLCGGHARAAREEGLRVFRLAATLAWEEHQAQKASAFFAAYKAAEVRARRKH